MLGIAHLHIDFEYGYEEYFVNRYRKQGELEKFKADIVAIEGYNLYSRIQSQNGVFTLHSNISKPLEVLNPEAIIKIDIPEHVKFEAKRFLQLAGIDTFSLFPDLDGLVKHLLQKNK